MASRRKNLLEAFSHSAGSQPAAAPPPKAAAELPLFEAAAGGTSPSRRPVQALLGIAIVLAFVLGFLLGRARTGEVEASPADPARVEAPPTQPRSFQERPSEAAADSKTPGVSGDDERIEDSALFDAANVYTVVVAAYGNKNDDHAWASHEFLRDAGIPVFRPVASKNLILVLAGAAPTSAELARTMAAVQRLERDGKKVFHDAYLARIDQLIPRTTPKGQ